MAFSWTVVVVALNLVFGICAEQINYPAYPEDVREEHPSTDLEAPDATWQAQEGQIPYQLFIRAVAKNGGVTTCGGSIIHAEWGLTAAHCTALRTSLIIKAGTTNLSNADVIIETETWYNHPRFIEVLQRVVQPNDISLIKFGLVLEFSDKLRPIQLQRSFDQNRNYEDVRMINSGWGHTWTGILARTVNITQSGMSCTNSQDNTTRTCTKERIYTDRAIAVQLQSHTPEYLNWAYMRGLSNEACIEAYNYAVHIQESTLCAVFDDEATQTNCLGDSGGPLTVEDDDGNPVLVGVTSFVSGLGCHTVFAPFGFIRPGYYHEWFANVTGIDFDTELWTNNEEGNETTTEESELTESTSESSTNEESSSEESNTETTTESNIDWSTPYPTEESSSEQTSETTPTPEETYSSTTEDATTPELTTESGTGSSTSPPVGETTQTTLVTEELYPSTTSVPTTSEPPSSSSQNTEPCTESSTDSSTIELTSETTHFTEESAASTTEELTTTESPTSISESSSSEPSPESSTYASTSQPIEETTTSPGSEESDTITTDEPPTTEQQSSNNATASSETASESNTQPIAVTTTTPGPEEFNPSTTEDLSTPESPTPTNEPSTPEETTKTSETTILDISFTKPNFETTVITNSSTTVELSTLPIGSDLGDFVF